MGGGGVGYSGNKSDAHANPDISRYPHHVPTVREQLAGSKAALDPDDLTKQEVESFTAIGVLANPLAFRSHYEDQYDDTTPSKRTADARLTREDLTMAGKSVTPRIEPVLDEAGFATPAFVVGPDADQTVYPSSSRE